MENYTNVRTVTIRDYLRVLFSHKTVIILTIITVMMTIFIGLTLRTKIYEANVKILVSAQRLTDPDYIKKQVGIFETYTQGEIVTSNPVIERTVKALGLHNRPLDYEKKFSSWLKSALIDYRLKEFKFKLEELEEKQRLSLLFRMAVEDLRQRIEIRPVKDTKIFTIAVRDFDPVGAAVMANSLSRSYVIFDLEQQLAELTLKYGEKHSVATQLTEKIKKIQETLHGNPLPDIEAIGPATVKIIEQAQIPFEPVKTLNKSLSLIIGFFISILLGISVAFGFERFDQTFKSPQDVETFLDLPFLGSIPKRRFKHNALITDSTKATSYTKSYQNLSDQIYLLIKEKNLRSLLITGIEGSGEVTGIIANLGIYLARKSGRKVLIIDANLRNPSIHKILNTSDNPGLADVLEDKVSFDLAIQDVDSNLAVLTSGKTELNPCTLLDSSMMSDVIKKAKDRYDIVFINSADLRNFTDTVILSTITDGIALVIDEGKVRQQVVKSAIAPLEQKKANLIGVILNNRKHAIPEIIYKLT